MLKEKHTKPEPTSQSERVLDAACDLFARRGVAQVELDDIAASASCDVAAIETMFGSRHELARLFMVRRERCWTHEWLEAGIRAASDDPAGRLLAIFDVFHDWFQKPDFEGCSFINIMLESRPSSDLRMASVLHLGNIRALLIDLALEAGLARPVEFAQTWHILMKGSIVTANEGHRDAALHAGEAARTILKTWPRNRRGDQAPG